MADTAPGPRSAYHRSAEADPESFLTNRGHMYAFFQSDVRRMPSPKWPLGRPASGASSTRFVRILQWNVNVLMGVSGRDPVQPADVFSLIEHADADVVLLQEGGLQAFPDDIAAGYSEYYQQPVARLNGRVERLHVLLQEAGYSLLIADGAFSENPSLVATRLQIVEKGESFDVDGDFRARGTAGDGRSGRLVQLALPGEPPDGARLGVIVTHLHHTERAGLKGVRSAEVAALLQHWRAAGGGVAESPMTATVLATDMNFPRRRDYSEREWQVIRAGFGRLGEPEDDGVADALADAGFVCAYDRSDAGPPTFTHWTSTTVDFAWCHFREPANWRVWRAEVLPSALSDHLPVVTDLQWKGAELPEWGE